MTAMTIQNYTGTADLFTWPNNPQSYDLQLSGNSQITQIAFKDYNVYAAGNGSGPKGIVLVGEFHGDDRWTNFRLLGKHIGQNKLLKKLTFESDKFYICLGKDLKQTNAGGRTNNVDYNALFHCVFNLLFSTTQKTTGTNAGHATTYVEEISGTVTNGAVDITVTDALGNAYTIDSSVFATDQAIVVKMVSMVDVGNGVAVTTFRYTTVAGSRVTKVKTTGGDGMPRLDPGANMTTITITNLTNPVVKFRDAYYV